MRIWTTCIGQRLDGAENTRSMLLCAELLRRGHDVTMWTSAYDHIRKQWRTEWREHPGGLSREDRLDVRFMKGCGYEVNISVRRFADHYLAARDFTRLSAAAPRPDVIVASLPDHLTAAAAVEFGRRHGVPTIVDVRDKWPDVFLDRVAGSWRSAIAVPALSWESRRSARTLRGATSIVAVMQSLMDWGLTKAGRERTDADRVIYLTTSPRNFEIERTRPVDSQIANVIAKTAGRTVFAFVGTFNQTQHPSLVLDAIDLLADQGRLESQRLAVVIAGDGVGADEVRRRAERHADVHYVGWVNSDQMSDLLAATHVGLLPMNFASPAFNNKAFAYLASGIPIINGATGDLATLMSDERAGVNITAASPASLADAITMLASQGNVRDELTRNIRRLFAERFDRDANYRGYADHVEHVATQRRV